MTKIRYQSSQTISFSIQRLDAFLRWDDTSRLIGIRALPNDRDASICSVRLLFAHALGVNNTLRTQTQQTCLKSYPWQVTAAAWIELMLESPLCAALLADNPDIDKTISSLYAFPSYLNYREGRPPSEPCACPLSRPAESSETPTAPFKSYHVFPAVQPASGKNRRSASSFPELGLRL